MPTLHSHSLRGERVPRQALWVVLVSVLALVPVVAALLLLHGTLDVSIRQYRPVESDEFTYWRSIARFAESGLHGGYIGFQESAPAVRPGGLGPWGPVYAALYGSAASVTGWHYWSPPLYSLMVLAGALVSSFLLVRRSRLTVVVLLVVVTTFAPLYVYAVSGMQEPFHHALAILLAVLVSRSTSGATHGFNRAALALLLLVVGASLVRPTWSPLLVLPCVLLAPPRRVPRLAAGLAGLAGAFVLTVLFRWWSAPVAAAGFGGVSTSAADGPLGAIRAVLRNMLDNLEVLSGWYQPVSGRLQPVEGWLVLACAAVVVATGITLSIQLVRRRHVPAANVAVMMGLACGFVVPVTTLLALYEYSFPQGMRVTMPPLLFAIVLCATAPVRLRSLRLVPLMAVFAFAASAPLAVDDFIGRNAQNYAVARDPVIAQVSRSFAGAVEPSSDDDPWCNTVLVSLAGLQNGLFPWQLVGVHPTLAFNVDLGGTLPRTLRSRYVVADDIRLRDLPGASRLKHLAELGSLGHLYENPDRRGCAG